MNLPERIVALHEALAAADIPHAFGGALALAWCTHDARGTKDVDINLFVAPEQATEVLDALPDGVLWTDKDVRAIKRDGQARLWWDKTPVDVFFNNTDFHEHLSAGVRIETFAGRELPFLSCRDLAVFKAFFNRTKDWADLEEMHAAGTLDVDLIGVLVRLLGNDDPRVERLLQLTR